MSEYQAFVVELSGNVAHVQINRPEKINAMNAAFWTEIIDIFQWIEDTDAVRVVVLSGAGKHFSSGIDLMMLASVANELGKDAGRNARLLRRKILERKPRSTPWTSAASRCWRRSRATASAAPST